MRLCNLLCRMQGQRGWEFGEFTCSAAVVFTIKIRELHAWQRGWLCLALCSTEGPTSQGWDIIFSILSPIPPVSHMYFSFSRLPQIHVCAGRPAADGAHRALPGSRVPLTKAEATLCRSVCNGQDVHPEQPGGRAESKASSSHGQAGRQLQ